MTQAKLTGSRIKAGVWEGLLTGQGTPPHLEVMHLEKSLDGVRVTEVSGTPDQWAVQVPIPLHALNDGVQTFIIRDTGTRQTLAHFTLIADTLMAEDIRAEIDLLRAELDLLKRAFRRHCVESEG